jgi:hypothetical protein
MSSSKRVRCIGPGAFAAVLLCAVLHAGEARAAMAAPSESMQEASQVMGAASISTMAAAAAAGPQSGAVGGPLTTLYEGTTMYTGVSFTQMELDLPSAGTLWVDLKDMEFVALSGALSFALVKDGSVLEVQDGSGSFSLDVSGPTRLFAFVYGVAEPGVNVASYFLSIRHEASEPVPLPASLWLLLSGMALAGWSGRRRTPAPSSQLPA